MADKEWDEPDGPAQAVYLKTKAERMQATLFKVDGTQKIVVPKDGKAFSLDELSNYVGGYVQTILMPSGKMMVVNDEGMLDGLPLNQGASEVWENEFPISQYPHNNNGFIVGDAVVCDEEMIH